MRRSSPPTEHLTGWGRTGGSAAARVTPRDVAEIEQLLAGLAANDRGHVPWRPDGVIARGSGRSYNDAAQRAGGAVVDLSAFGSIGEVDQSTGQVTVGAGATIASVIEKVLPAGWFVPVTPGTSSVTIGGAIAADVHGKNHHGEGSFCSHVTSMLLVTPSGTHRIGPTDQPELFWATAGGMGLTGMVTEARLRLLPVESAAVAVTTRRYDDLYELMATMDATDGHHRYSVAWVDCASRRHPGRGVLSQGDHASFERAGPSWSDRPAVAPTPRATLPRPLPCSIVGAQSVKTFNAAWFRRAPRRPSESLTPLWSYFYPLDALGNWNYLYGPSGFVQYQFAVDPRHGDVVGQAIAMVAAADAPCSLAVLKRFGPANPGLLSFPIEGWTLALDFAVGPDSLPGLLDRLDLLVAESGGRVYLAKDARIRPELISVMYPRSAELDLVRRRVDPSGVIGSDLSSRLLLGCPAKVLARA